MTSFSMIATIVVVGLITSVDVNILFVVLELVVTVLVPLTRDGEGVTGTATFSRLLLRISTKKTK